MREDSLAEVDSLLRRAAQEDDALARESVEAALMRLDALREGWAIEPPRAAAYRAEALRRLGRLREAAAAYAVALEERLSDAQALWEGLVDLSESLCGHEEVLRLVVRARAKHPGRSWQWDPLAEQAQKRLDLEAKAPLSPEALAALRSDVAKRLLSSPCCHDDDRRPLTAAAATEMGLDAAAVLEFVGSLGACCCDCQVTAVRGPREPI